MNLWAMNLWALNLKDVPGQIQTDRANLACQPVSNGDANHPSLLHIRIVAGVCSIKAPARHG
jgi:hypothetical protein